MTYASVLKLGLLSASLLGFSGCGLASLPGGYTPIEKQTLSDLRPSNYVPRTADQRAAVLTQGLFAQAAFWSREYDLNPADLEAAINLASTLRRLNNPAKAVEITTQTRALYPRDVDLMTELSAALIANNQPQKAMEIIDAALRQRPDHARLWSMKGAALDQVEMYDQARQHYSRALQLAPNDAGIMANVGLSYALEGDPRTAEVWLRRAANTPGASAAVRQNLVLVLGLQGKTEDAQKWANRDLNTNPAQRYTNPASTRQNVPQQAALAGPVTSPATSPITNPITSPPPRPVTQPVSSAANISAPRIYGQLNPVQLPQPRQPQRSASTQQPVPLTASPHGFNLTMPGNPNGPKTAREAALQMAEQRLAGSAQYQAQPVAPSMSPAMPPSMPLAQQQIIATNVAPQSVLERIAQNNLSKRTLAQQQQAQYQALAQQRAMQQRVQQQQYGAPATPPTGQPYGHQPYPPQVDMKIYPQYNSNYAQNQQDTRTPARTRRR
ncbi:MAG: hypothetical protein COA69_03700 [Robiginitomaculum sp.]|nr:MAG: hypothetical protein COA69_03700 [Robiginitomaculum sp.]